MKFNIKKIFSALFLIIQRVKRISWFKKKHDNIPRKSNAHLAIIDSTFPSEKPFGFRNFEITSLLEKIDGAKAFMMFPMRAGKKAWFSHSYGHSYFKFKTNLAAYTKLNPHSACKIEYLPCVLHARLAYSYFLAETYTLLPYYNKNKIPFVFVLYPGGAFGLKNSSSDAMLKEIFSSTYFRKVIVTQKTTYRYLIDNKLCENYKIEFLFGGFLQFMRHEIPERVYYKETKKTFDVCFVAAKYSKYGVDKGYDLFIEAAKYFCNKYEDICFHVIGGFNDKEIDVSSLGDRITFYDYLTPEELKKAYPKMDICVSPNRLYKLYEGNFDGFPLGCEAMCFKTVLMTTDELNDNDGFFSKDELVIIRPTFESITKNIDFFYKDPQKLKDVGAKGQHRIFELLEPNKRLEKIISILEEEVKAVKVNN